MENKLHPIQLKNIIVKQLSFQLKNQKETTEGLSVQIGSTYAPYDPVAKSITVSLQAVAGQEDTAQFCLIVELSGVFSVNEQEFDVAKLNLWADQNAPFILFPFLREQIYGLTIRAGIPPQILSMVEVPRPEKKPVEPN